MKKYLLALLIITFSTGVQSKDFNKTEEMIETILSEESGSAVKQQTEQVDLQQADDTTTSTEKIDNLEFQTLKMKVTYPNNMVLYVHMFSRLFGKREFSVNIMYVDKHKGELMLSSWRNSKFGQK